MIFGYIPVCSLANATDGQVTSADFGLCGNGSLDILLYRLKMLERRMSNVLRLKMSLLTTISLLEVCHQI